MFCLYVVDYVDEPECCFFACLIFVFWIVSCVFIFGMDEFVGERTAVLRGIEGVVDDDCACGVVIVAHIVTV